MKLRAQPRRIPPKYRDWVRVPEEFRGVVWDCVDGMVVVEDLVVKVLMHPDFERLRRRYELDPEVVRHVAFTYPEIHRGVKYWVKKWSATRRK